MSDRRRRLLKVVESISRAPRPIEVAFGVLALVWVFIYLPMRFTFGRPPVVVAVPSYVNDSVLSVASRYVDPNGVLSLPTPPYVMDLGEHEEIARNPFIYKTPTPTPVPPTPTPPPPTPPPPVVVPPSPTPPPTPPYATPLSLLGLAESSTRRIAFLKSEQGIYYALVGDVVSVKDKAGAVTRHRIIDIELDKVKIGPETGPGEVVLQLRKDERK